MTLRLAVQQDAWRDHVRTLAARVDGLIPVVKGNGYGFGREHLVDLATELLDLTDRDGPLAVGTVYEAAGLDPTRPLLVLVPQVGPLPQRLGSSAILGVGATHHLDALRRAGWTGRVHLKLRSSMNRYGVSAAEVPQLCERLRSDGMSLHGCTLHLPLAGTDEDRIAEAETWLGELDSSIALSLSHLAPEAFAGLRNRYSTRRLQLRLGTALWHGDKSTLRLVADVLDVRGVGAGERCGYRSSAVPCDGHLVIVGAGSSHGVVPLPDGRSPLHFARRRMELLEPPHMHTTMVLVPHGAPCPQPGQWVDVQRPLTMVAVDEVTWT